MERLRYVLLGTAIGLFTILAVATIWSFAARDETAKVCDAQDRICASRTQTPGFLFASSEDELWISVGPDNCGTAYAMPFDTPNGDLDVKFHKGYLEVNGPDGEMATYPTTGGC
jgi:hypothetical protein